MQPTLSDCSLCVRKWRHYSIGAHTHTRPPTLTARIVFSIHQCWALFTFQRPLHVSSTAPFFDTSLIYNRAFCNPSHFNTLCLSAIVNNQLQRWILLLQTLLNMIFASACQVLRFRSCFKNNKKERDIESNSVTKSHNLV